jgi:SHS2 domain-containing protein
MPYRFLEDVAIADVAFEAWADTIEALFSEAAAAFLSVMIGNPTALLERERRFLQVTDNALDMLLFQLLQELIFIKDSQQLLLRVQSIGIREKEGCYTLDAEAAGETIDPLRHELIVDVKAVTLHRLRVERTPQRWEATVVLDI